MDAGNTRSPAPQTAAVQPHTVKVTEQSVVLPSVPAARLRARLVFVALLGVIPIALVVQWSDLIVGGTMMAGPFPPLAASLLWCLLLLFQHSLHRKGSTPPFTRSEMLALLAVWIGANMVVGRGMLHPLLASLAGPVYYARSGAMARAIPHDLPSWLAVTNKAAAQGFFEGHGIPVPWDAWRAPLITWSLFFIPFIIANISLCVLFERMWVRHEKLAFPLVALPIEALNAERDAGKSPIGFRLALIFGVAVPVLLHGFGVAHAYMPGIPCVPFFNDISAAVANPPWTAIRPLYVNFYPLLVGLTFLAPTDVTFSVWFFLILNKLEMVVAGASGWSDGATGGGITAAPPYLEEQSAGAYIALCGILIWNARNHLGKIVQASGGGAVTALLRRIAGSSRTDSRAAIAEYREYCAPAWGLALGAIGILFWCVRTGLPLWFSACFFGFYFAVALVLSRLMAEGGVSWILAPILPDKLIFGLAGSASLGSASITRLALQVQHLRDTRQMIAPAIMETGKLRDEGSVPRLPFYLLMFVAIALALVVGTGAALPIFYHHGALILAPNSDGLMMSASVVPLTGVNQASARLLHPIRPSAGGAGGLMFGVGLTLILSVLRTHVIWWPLHPLGYALTGTLQLGYANKMLFSIFLGWLFKTITLRFGGARGYRYLRGAALGLVLGDLMMGGILKLLDALFGPSGYAIF